MLRAHNTQFLVVHPFVIGVSLSLQLGHSSRLGHRFVKLSNRFCRDCLEVDTLPPLSDFSHDEYDHTVHEAA